MYNASDQLLNRLRGICLGFPRVIEKEAWGECTFRVAGGKMFAMTDNNHHESGHVAVWVLAPPNIQEHLIRSMPAVSSSLLTLVPRDGWVYALTRTLIGTNWPQFYGTDT
ncbi:MAG: MmcQ/YjbR family DNA-binding protein [Deltaproteobacteria bacterium]|nr:MmcQ/YjbR family DNA-binding protein [Deltaproteobacteria bacterium]